MVNHEAVGYYIGLMNRGLSSSDAYLETVKRYGSIDAEEAFEYVLSAQRKEESIGNKSKRYLLIPKFIKI